MELNTGVCAALRTVFCWTASSLLFEAAGKRIGSLSVDLIRLLMAFFFFSITLTISRGSPIPLDFSAHAWFWLGLSGFIGFMLGDMMLFQAFVEVGPRISMLVLSLVPPMTALIGWYFLGETYGAHQWLGMVVTLAGVGWVVLERPKNNGQEDARKLRVITLRGILLAFGGAVGQAVAFVMSKHGIEKLDPFAATQIRVIAGLIGFAGLFAVIGVWPKVWRSLGDRNAMLLVGGGAAAGPYLGVALLMWALHYTSTGVASTIVALVPVALIPAAMLIDKERVSWRALAGTLVAVGGVVMLLGGS